MWFAKIAKNAYLYLYNYKNFELMAKKKTTKKQDKNTKPLDSEPIIEAKVLSEDDRLKTIEKFNFSNLHIVTDMVEWEHLTEEKLEKMNFHVNVPQRDRVSAQKSIDYFNSFVDGFAKFNPIVKKRTISEDFNFIRSFNNILFEHGTLGWWASVLSDAKKVGVYGPWRPWKGASNKNLSNVDIEGWFKWE